MRTEVTRFDICLQERFSLLFEGYYLWLFYFRFNKRERHVTSTKVLGSTNSRTGGEVGGKSHETGVTGRKTEKTWSRKDRVPGTYTIKYKDLVRMLEGDQERYRRRKSN